MKNDKTCKRKLDGKIFNLPRRFTRKRCAQGISGFSMRSSCAPYKSCFKDNTKKLRVLNKKGGEKNKKIPNKKTKKQRKIKGISVINMNNINGVVQFIPIGLNKVQVKYEITGLQDGKHGFHIHECGDMTKGCDSGCAHFNPKNQNHGGPHSKIRHAGDLGNITALNGLAKGTITVKGISTNNNNTNSIIGRMIIIHKDKDDLGKGGNLESLKTGNAGKRIACAIIGLTY